MIVVVTAIIERADRRILIGQRRRNAGVGVDPRSRKRTIFDGSREIIDGAWSRTGEPARRETAHDFVTRDLVDAGDPVEHALLEARAAIAGIAGGLERARQRLVGAAEDEIEHGVAAEVAVERPTAVGGEDIVALDLGANGVGPKGEVMAAEYPIEVVG